ncbi:hypothetical protein [Tetragenococcus halophilus]|uniref:hypothetical protein n=1 Tax=Tetragenococcus halophilus TaxID=51669 RepID=UPI0030E93477
MFDTGKQRQDPIGQFEDILFNEQFPEVDFTYTTDIKEAYEGADFVFKRYLTAKSLSIDVVEEDDEEEEEKENEKTSI